MTDKLTVAALRGLIENAIENTEIPDKVAAILERFDGKKITKRIATAVAQALPDWTVYYDTNYGMKHLKMWQHNMRDDQISFLLGYDSGDGLFHYANFRTEYNACYYGAAQDRNAHRARNLKADEWQRQVVAAVNAINDATARLKWLTQHPEPDATAIWNLVEGK
jgi:hypothetical protein